MNVPKSVSPRQSTAALAGLLMCGLVQVIQASESNTIEELVVSGAALPTESAKLSSSITLLSAQDIERRNPSNIVQLLRGIEGVQITQPGGRGGVASLYIRGGEANFTTVFVDGIKVNNPNNTRGGSFDFATLDLANLQRVEVIRGPQSAIFGSDALSGVVNFITRKPTENELALKLEQGELGYSRSVIRGSVKLSNNHQFSLGGARTDDRSALSGGDFDSTTLWGNLLGQSTDQSLNYHLSFTVADSNQTRFPEDSGGAVLAQLRELEIGAAEDIQAALRVKKTWNPLWEGQLLLTHYERAELSDSPGVLEGQRDGVPPNRFDSNLRRRYLQLSSRYSQESHTITFGADFQAEDARSSGEVLFAPGFSIPSLYTIDRDIAGVFIDGNFELGNGLTLLASLRYDYPDTADSRVSPSVGLIHRFDNEKTSVKANWSKGFKLPSFFALASPLVGNPNLREEEVTTLDIEFSHQLSTNSQFKFSLFDSDYTDLVDFDSDAFTNVNRDQVAIRGAESVIDMALSSKLLIRTFVSYNDIDVKPNGELRQRPQWRGGLEASFTPSPDMQVNGLLSRVGNSFDSSIPTDDGSLEAYTRFDLTASWRQSDKLKISAAIDNLLDKQYFEAIGFPAVGRRFRIALDLQI